MNRQLFKNKFREIKAEKHFLPAMTVATFVIGSVVVSMSNMSREIGDEVYATATERLMAIPLIDHPHLEQQYLDALRDQKVTKDEWVALSQAMRVVENQMEAEAEKAKEREAFGESKRAFFDVIAAQPTLSEQPPLRPSGRREGRATAEPAQPQETAD